MHQDVVFESFPVFVLTLERGETDLRDARSIAERLRADIEAHPYARFLGIFDHHAHTRALGIGEIEAGILDARCVVFCFGMSISCPEALALRPRSIGVAELSDRFVISFLEPPMPLVNTAMEGWARGLARFRPEVDRAADAPAGSLPGRWAGARAIPS